MSKLSISAGLGGNLFQMFKILQIALANPYTFEGTALELQEYRTADALHMDQL